MTEVVANNSGAGCDLTSSSPEQSPPHPWPMVPVLQTLTVLSDGEEMEQMEQKMGIENGQNDSGDGGHYLTGLSVTKSDANSSSLSPYQPTTVLSVSNSNSNHTMSYNQKRKVGRPITSVKTMNRSFPAVDEIRAKLEAGECYVRPRASSSSSDVWALFQEVAYKDNHLFTGIVQCKSCYFLTRYHGQITGTSHMRRHQCFSLLFPNSTPANRKPKANSQTNNRPTPSSTANSPSFNVNMDADSTTPRMLKKLKKDMSAQLIKGNDYQSPQIGGMLVADQTSASVSAAAVHHLKNHSNITIHPMIPKKKFKNGNSIVPHPNERSLISTVVTANGGNGNHNHQSMLRPLANGYNSPSSSSAASSSPHHQSQHQSTSSPTNCSPMPTTTNQVSTIANNLKLNSIKQDLREKLIQFCSEELVPLKSVVSESFRSILRSHLRLCTTQMLQQFVQQPQMMNLASTISSCMNSIQIPDLEQLRSYLEILYRQCQEAIRQDVSQNLENNVGSALVCDSDQDACIISVYYCDVDWRLTESILSSSASVFDINQFVSRTLENYGLQERKKLSKFTFVSHGGLFGGVSVCLSSMAHIVDKVVDEALSSVDELSSNDNEKNHRSSTIPHLNDLFDSCHELAIRTNIQLETNDVEWITKYELMKTLLNKQSNLNGDDMEQSSNLPSVDFNLIEMIVKLLEPFRTASDELRQCYRHPTLCHVLLYFYKLKKVLSFKPNAPTTDNNHKTKSCSQIKTKKLTRHSSDHSDSDSNEEKDIYESKSTRKRSKSKADEESSPEDEDEDKSVMNVQLLMDRLKQALMDNLMKYYQVQSLHRIATFLWPNFRLLKMLTADEQKEIHEDVRKLIQLRISTKSVQNNSQNSSNSNNQSLNDSKYSSNNEPNNNGMETKSRSNFDEWEVSSDQDQDEVDKYLSVQLTSCSEDFILQWWKEHSNEFPKLSQLAKWVLSIPASVTTRERFQIAKNRQVDDMLLFLHCNIKTEKFHFASMKKMQSKMNKSKNSMNNSVCSSKNVQPNNYASSLIANN